MSERKAGKNWIYQLKENQWEVENGDKNGIQGMKSTRKDPPGARIDAMSNHQKCYYRKTPKNSDIRKNCSKSPKIGRVSFYYRVMGPKDADGMANSADPDLEEQSDLGLPCLPRHVCPKTSDLYGN